MATFISFDATLPGNVLLTVAFATFAAALTRIDPAVWQPPGARAAPRLGFNGLKIRKEIAKEVPRSRSDWSRNEEG